MRTIKCVRMKSNELLNKLALGKDNWNKWHREEIVNKEERLDFGTTDLSEFDLTEYDLRGVVFSTANLNRTDLRWADLTNANFNWARLPFTIFDYAFMRGATFRNTIFEETSFEEACLWKTDFYSCILKRLNFKNADLSEAYLANTDLYGADLRGANLSKTNLLQANLSRANLRGANLNSAICVKSTFFKSIMNEANLYQTDFREANISYSILRNSNLNETNFENAILSGSYIYGISVWNTNLKNCLQHDLIITKHNEPEITVDDLEMAHFIYLLLDNRKIRLIIDTIATKTVLILGRFSKKRKQVLDSIKDLLRNHGYVPIMFDFKGPSKRDITETITMLAHMVSLVIADITDPKSIPQELTSIIPNTPSLPIIPLLEDGQNEYGMFEHFKKYPWVYDIIYYKDSEHVMNIISEIIIKKTR